MKKNKEGEQKKDKDELSFNENRLNDRELRFPRRRKTEDYKAYSRGVTTIKFKDSKIYFHNAK